MAWLKSQQLFLNELLKTPDIEEVVCLGDVFDTRVGVQTHVATFAREWFSKWKVPVAIIAGNHDYYSPDTDKYCALDNVLAGIPGLTIVSHDILVRDHQVFIPWYDQEREGITELSKKYKGNIVFTHADIGMSRCKLLKTLKVFANEIDHIILITDSTIGCYCSNDIYFHNGILEPPPTPPKEGSAG